MYLLIPGGPGLGANSIKSLALSLKGSQVLPYETPIEGMSPDDLFQEMVSAGINALRGIPVKLRVVVGHSFGGLIAKEISNAIEVKETILIGTPLDQKCYQNVFDNYANKASILTKSLENEFALNPSDESLSRWLASYQELYFSKKFIQSGSDMLMEEFANYSVFKLLSNYGYENCTKICNKTINGNVVVFGGLEDKLIDHNTLRQSSEKFGFNFLEILDGSHFSIFETPEQIKYLIEKGQL